MTNRNPDRDPSLLRSHRWFAPDDLRSAGHRARFKGMGWDDGDYQDKPIIESQRPHPLPLDLKEELHVRSDKYCVAYRRWLKELGVTWGVSQ